MGKGFEDKAHYEKCELQFLNIDNIHAIRGALDKLSDLCSPEQRNNDDNTWYCRGTQLFDAFSFQHMMIMTMTIHHSDVHILIDSLLITKCTNQRNKYIGYRV
jgi:hypothetical protein